MSLPIRPDLAAARILAWARERAGETASLAIPVDDLAAQLDLAVAPFDGALNPGVLGYLEPGESLIFVRVDLPEPMRRFTVAHEIGHAALHRSTGLAAEVAAAGGDLPDESDGCDADDLLAVSTEDEALAPGQAYSARAQREAEANAFAAALLLPADATLEAYRALCAGNHTRPVVELGRQFGVSEEVALRRLASLLTEPQLFTEAPPSAREAEDVRAVTQHEALDESQRQAVEAPAPALVVAGPGSGKTRALVARARYLVEQRGVAPERILALTFSRKAAAELAERMRLALPDRQQPWVGTIHSFCGDLLRRFGAQVGVRPDFHLVTDVEGYTILRRALTTAPLLRIAPLAAPEMYLRSIHDQIGRAKDALITPEMYQAAAQRAFDDASTADEREAAEKALEVATAYTAYQQALEAQGDADYGDLICQASRALREVSEARESLRERFDHLLVDEYQDINYAMAVALREIAGPERAIWAVGDADQAIYRFRGASPENLRRFERDFPGAQTFALNGNYRSHPDIVRAARAFAKSELPGEERILLPMRQASGESSGLAVTLAAAADEESELDGLAAALRARADQGIPLASQAILLRTRRQVESVAKGLLARHAPVRTPLPLFERPFTKDTLAALSLAVDPLSAALLRPGALPDLTLSDDDARALIAQAVPRSLAPLDAAREPQALLGVSPAGRAALRRLITVVDDLRAASTVAAGMSRYLFSLTPLGLRLLDGDLKSERGSAARLLEIARAYDDTVGRAGSDRPGQAPGRADWAGFFDYVRIMMSLRGEAGVIDVDDDEDAALVLTAHGSKGLEFPVVYLPRLVKGKFPHSGADRSGVICPPAGLQSPSGEPLEQSGDEEEANLFYVAITRARDALTLSYAKRSGSRAAHPSPFIAPLEQALGFDLQRVNWTRAEVDPFAEWARYDGSTVVPDPVEAPQRPYSLNELSSYARCPQRYAYEYDYGLFSKPSPLADYTEILGQAAADLRARWREGLTRDEAVALFEERWTRRRHDPDVAAGAASSLNGAADEAHAAVLARYGQRMMERLWGAMSADSARADAAQSEPGAEANAADDLAGGETRRVTVRLGDIAIDGPVTTQTAAAQPSGGGSGGRGVGGGEQALWLTQRRASVAASPTPDLRDLFHALVAEELAAEGVAPEVYHVALATGERKPVKLQTRKRISLEEEALAAAEGIAKRRFEPKPSERTCQNCPFVLVCPA